MTTPGALASHLAEAAADAPALLVIAFERGVRWAGAAAWLDWHVSGALSRAADPAAPVLTRVDLGARVHTCLLVPYADGQACGDKALHAVLAGLAVPRVLALTSDALQTAVERACRDVKHATVLGAVTLAPT